MMRLKKYALAIVIISSLVLAEGTNPFGTGTPPPNEQGFSDDDFLNPPPTPFGMDNSGVDPNASAPPPPPEPSGQPESNPNIPAPRSPSPTLTGRASPHANQAASPQKTAGKKPAAPRLADYLELDAAAKGLEVKNFDLPNKDIKEVVTLISKLTGKNFILDNKVRGTITIMGPSQVTLQEAYQAFLSALDANNLTTVQSGKFIRIIDSGEARRAPVRTYTGDYAPKDDQFITSIFQLKYINADEVQREFRDLTTRQGKLFAYEPTNTIIITDTGSNIQRLKDIMRALDVKNFETTLHVLKIKNSSAKGISEMLGEIYGGNKGQTAGRNFRQMTMERTRGGGIITKIIPDELTNSLVVLANGAGFESLKQLVARLDVKGTSGRIHVYYCAYAKAEDLAQTLSSLAGGGGGKKSTRTPTSPSQAGGIAGGSSVSSGGGPVSADIGDAKVTSDGPTNSLVITASASDYKALIQVIRKLDIPRLQVYMETVIAEIVIDNRNNYGLNVGAVIGGTPPSSGGAFVGDKESLEKFLPGGIGSILPGTAIPIFGPSFTTQVPGGGTKPATILGLLTFIATNQKASILSTPQIIALDNEKATFKVEDVVPVISGSNPVNTQLPGGGSQAGYNIDNKKIGITINLTPHVNAKTRSIRLEIEQQVDTINKAVVPLDLKNTQVGTTSRITNTQVMIKDGNFIVLGGLMRDSVDEAISKIPLLGDIPVLGWLFKSRTSQNTKTNLVILLHPQIIGTTLESANLVSDKMGQRQEFIDDEMGGTERHEKSIGRIKEGVKAQTERGNSEKGFDYRSNDYDDDIDEEPDKTIPNPSTEFKSPDQINSSNKQNTAKVAVPQKNLDTVPVNPPSESEGEIKP